MLQLRTTDQSFRLRFGRRGADLAQTVSMICSGEKWQTRVAASILAAAIFGQAATAAGIPLGPLQAVPTNTVNPPPAVAPPSVIQTPPSIVPQPMVPTGGTQIPDVNPPKLRPQMPVPVENTPLPATSTPQPQQRKPNELMQPGVKVHVTETIWPTTDSESRKWHVQEEPPEPIKLNNPDTSSSGPLLKETIYQSNQYESVQELLDEAIMRSPRAAAIRSNLGIARSAYAYQLQSPNPMFFMDRGVLAEAVRRLGPTINFPSPWQICFGLLLAKQQVNQQRIDIWRDLWSLRADVQRAYSDVVIAQETEAATVALMDLAERTEQVTSKRLLAGSVPEFDLVRARLAREQAQLDFHQAQRRVLKAKQHLSLILGRQLNRPINVAPITVLDRPDTNGPIKDDWIPNLSHEVPDVSIFTEQARRFRWDIKDMQQQIVVNRAALKDAFANAAPMPQLIFGQSVSGNQPSGPKLTATFFTLSAPVPVTNVNQGDIEKFKATGKQLHWAMGAVTNQADTEVSQAYQDLMTYRERIQLYREHVLADSLESVRLSRRSYEVGYSDITTVIQAQQANFQIQLQYVSDVQAYQYAYIALEQAVGMPLQ
jgi:cobalt-zinc-cadmium efflux system outer membrane protein